MDTQDGEETACTTGTTGGSVACVQAQSTAINDMSDALEKLTESGKQGAASETTKNEKPTGNMGAI